MRIGNQALPETLLKNNGLITTKTALKMIDMRIGVGLCFYNDYRSLRRLLTSLECCKFDAIIAVDGKYAEWPVAMDNLSEQRCSELLFEQKHIPVFYYPAPNMTQNQKRQIYMDKCETLGIDILVVLDTDDFVVCSRTNWIKFKADIKQKIADNQTYRQVYCIPCAMWDQWPHPNLDGQIQNIPRVFYKPWLLRYAENHFTIRNKKTGICQVFAGNVVCHDLHMAHDHSLRDTQYQQISTDYSKALLKWENEGKYR